MAILLEPGGTNKPIYTISGNKLPLQNLKHRHVTASVGIQHSCACHLFFLSRHALEVQIPPPGLHRWLWTHNLLAV
jgi:hypothetical protein